MKPWLSEVDGARLEAFLGSRGIKTHNLETTQNLIAEAARMFEVQTFTTCQEMADAIEALGKDERKKRFRANVTKQQRDVMKPVFHYSHTYSEIEMAARWLEWRAGEVKGEEAAYELRQAAIAIRAGTHRLAACEK